MIKINESLYVPAAPFGFLPRYPNGKKGYLQKQGHYIKNWRLRYFILEKTTLIDNALGDIGIDRNFVMNYYTDEKCSKLKGCYIINEETEIETVPEFDGKLNVITVCSLKSTGERETMYLSTSSEEDRIQWYNAIKEAMHGGFRSIVMSDISTGNFFPTHSLTVKFRLSSDSMTNDILVDDGNILMARDLYIRPRMTYSADAEYFTLLLLDMDFPSRAASDRRICVYWALVNVCQRNKTAVREVAPYLAPAPFYGTGLHRFIFLLYKQTHELDHAEVESSANWFTPREGFPYRQWKSSMGYVTPAGINGFYVEWDESVDTYHSLSKCFPPKEFMSPRQQEYAAQILAEKQAQQLSGVGSEETQSPRASRPPSSSSPSSSATPASTSSSSSVLRNRISKRSKAVVGLKRDKVLTKPAPVSAKGSDEDTAAEAQRQSYEPIDGESQFPITLKEEDEEDDDEDEHDEHEPPPMKGPIMPPSRARPPPPPSSSKGAAQSSVLPPPPPPPPQRSADHAAADNDARSRSGDGGTELDFGSLSIDNTERPKFKLPFDPEKRFKKLHKDIMRKSVMWEPALKAFLDDDD